MILKGETVIHAKMKVKLKISVAKHGDARAVFWTEIPEGELRDFVVEMNEIQITIHNEGVSE